MSSRRARPRCTGNVGTENAPGAQRNLVLCAAVASWRTRSRAPAIASIHTFAATQGFEEPASRNFERTVEAKVQSVRLKIHVLDLPASFRAFCARADARVVEHRR
jgi:hypothetical protein